MELLLTFMLMLLGAMALEPLAEKIRLPFSALLVVVGFVGSELYVRFIGDTGLRWDSFHHLILHVFVPILVFESALSMHRTALLRNIVIVLFLAIPAMLLASVVTGALVYWGIGYPVAFPFVAALLTGVMLSATDPVAVVALFNKLGAPPRLLALVEGESLFNDASAIVLFTLLVSIASSQTEFVAGEAIIDFGRSFGGGALLGVGLGWLSGWLCRQFRSGQTQALISLVVAAVTFYLAEKILHVSGIVALLGVGLFISGSEKKSSGADFSSFVGQLWHLLAYVCNAWLFLLVGATITWGMFESHWLAMLIGIVAATLARLVNIYALVPATIRLFRLEPIPSTYSPVLMWGGLRGAVSIALALSLPVAISSWYSIQSIVYGVVLFTLFVQAPIMPILVKKALADKQAVRKKPASEEQG